jgi:hypothetical protein
MAIIRGFLVLVVLVAAGCGDEKRVDSEEGRDGGARATATWVVADDDRPTPAAQSFNAMVERLGCAGGETGKVLRPTVVANEDQVIVTLYVEPLPPGHYTCPGNKVVSHVVALDEPIGERQLVDGACLAGEAVSTTMCSDGAVRWSPRP